ncbi:metallophosphoesterase family protein [Variovorax sp. VNK109]|uniref:metallophosphoesterase family protein n=1 Tax=Variovorax sp. VNK109 TaxID=3400919 RepID=UPI003BFE073D
MSHTRIAFVSDIHGNLPALEAVVADIARRSVDRIVCLGDNLSGPLLPRETARYLMASGWLVLAGNHERQVLDFERKGGGPSDAYALRQLGPEELAWMRSLKPDAWLSPDVFVCHGTPRSDCEHFLESVRGGKLVAANADEVRERLGTTRASLIACGHSHVPRSMVMPDGALLVNPGSVGLQAYDDDHPEPYVMEQGTPDARYAIVERTPHGWHVEQHSVAYDPAPMAALAAAQGRPIWEAALLRGTVR